MAGTRNYDFLVGVKYPVMMRLLGPEAQLIRL